VVLPYRAGPTIATAPQITAPIAQAAVTMFQRLIASPSRA
jgi:hypothetical protein